MVENLKKVKSRYFFKTQIFIAFFLVVCQFSFGQNSKLLDSLKLELKKVKEDTARITILRKMANVSQNLVPDSALTYAKQGLAIAERNHFQKGMSLCLNEIAYYYYGIGNNQLFYENAKKSLKISEKTHNIDCSARAMNLLGLYYNTIFNDSLAVFYYYKALSSYNELNNKTDAAAVINNLGILYAVKGNFPLALDYHFKALKINEELKNQNGCMWGYNYIASIYASQKSFDLALDYLSKALKFGKILQDKSIQSWAYMLKGDIYFDQNKNQLAMENYSQSMKIASETHEKATISYDYKRIGNIYFLTNNYDKATEYYGNSLKLSEEMDDKRAITEVFVNIAELLQKQGKLNESLNYGKKAMQLAEELKYPDMIQLSAQMLYKTYEMKLDFFNALKYNKLAVTANDSMFNIEKLKIIDNLKYNYELDKKQKAIVLLEKNKKLANQRGIIFGSGLVILLVIALFILSYKQRKSKEKQLWHEAEITVAKYKVESQQRDLTLKAIHITKQEQMLSGVKQQLETINNENPRTKETIKNVLSGIDLYLKQNSFEDFEKYFIEVHPEFYDKIKQSFPDITQHELRICALIKLNLNTKQIADITNKTTKSIEIVRYSIRKKMNLSPKDNLFDSIMQV